MTKADILELFEFARRKTSDLLDTVAKHPDATDILGWRVETWTWPRLISPGSSCTSRRRTTAICTSG